MKKKRVLYLYGNKQSVEGPGSCLIPSTLEHHPEGAWWTWYRLMIPAGRGWQISDFKTSLVYRASLLQCFYTTKPTFKPKTNKS